MKYDVVVIGAGWAGFNCSLKLRQGGLRVCLIEKSLLGGICLNAGCIPTKTLLEAARVANLIGQAEKFGLSLPGPAQINWQVLQERRQQIIQRLRNGMQFMLKGIDYRHGEARIISPYEVKIEDETVKTDYIVLATGSVPIHLSQLSYDHHRVLDSSDLLEIKEPPSKLVIIGAGAIGCEFAYLFASLGTKVTLVEKTASLLPGIDKEVSQRLKTSFQRKGIDVFLSQEATSQMLEQADLILLSVGRRPYIEDLGLEELGVVGQKGRLILDDKLRTPVKNIFAAGDCVGDVMLAHAARYQAEFVAANIIKEEGASAIDNSHIPVCIFTHPQIAQIGMSQEQAAKENRAIEVLRFDFLGLGMAHIQDQTAGFLKIVIDSQTRQILGAVIMGHQASELIAIFSVCLRNQMKAEELKKVIFAHPTFSEAIGEALRSL